MKPPRPRVPGDRQLARDDVISDADRDTEGRADQRCCAAWARPAASAALSCSAARPVTLQVADPESAVKIRPAEAQKLSRGWYVAAWRRRLGHGATAIGILQRVAGMRHKIDELSV